VYELSELRSQIAGVGRLLAAVAAHLETSNDLLREIANDTDRMPKIRKDDWDEPDA
jgi:hypothetical protein